MTDALAPLPQLTDLSVPWRDPHTLPREELSTYISTLEDACLAHPKSVDVRTMLGIAYAVGHDVQKAIDALEVAVELDPENFMAAFKYAEIHYRIHALNQAEGLTTRALNLASNPWQLALARRQMQEIRKLKRTSVRNLSWKMPFLGPAVAFSATVLVIAVVMLWK